jgi:predicted esterase
VTRRTLTSKISCKQRPSTMSSSESKPLSYSPPLIFSPSQTHQTTLIILHGRGSTAQKFAEPLLAHAVSSPPATPLPASTGEVHHRSFRDHFPNTKFVFPTAPLRRAVVFKRSLIHQWFDNWSLNATRTQAASTGSRLA